MLTDNTLVVLVTAGFLTILVLIMILRAIQHDRAVTAAGPIEELAVYDRRIEEKQRQEDDLDEAIEKRREAIANIADLQAEVDGLRRQKEELLIEWEVGRERREEVAQLRQEIEDAVIERQGLEAELVPLRAEYLEKKERLEKAGDLERHVSALEERQRDMQSKVDEQLGTLSRLESAEGKVEKLQDRAKDLVAENRRLEEQISTTQAREAELAARVAKYHETVAERQDELSQVEARVAAATIDERKLQGACGPLEARLAHLQAEIAEKERREIGGEAGESDALRDLDEMPPVVAKVLEWPLAQRQDEADALGRVKRRLRAKGLKYPTRTLHAFHTAMKVNETTQMAVLAGISGTGKSQLPRQYAAGMGIGFLHVPVQPRWDSPQDLMGFYNFIEKRFRPTDMARALWALDKKNNKMAAKRDRMMMILLDEMNLARVEYYFSDFLSRLESRPSPGDVNDENECKDAEIELDIPNVVDPPRIFPGYNLLFAGTMNEDESTQALSDKVVDRANILRFAAPNKLNDGIAEGKPEEPMALSHEVWKKWTRQSLSRGEEEEVAEPLDKMFGIMRGFGRPFGHRLGRSIRAYVANYPKKEGRNSLLDALADQVEMRLLPKLRGVEVENAEGQLSSLQRLVGEDLEDHALEEAIKQSVTSSKTTGQFVWRGVTRAAE